MVIRSEKARKSTGSSPNLWARKLASTRARADPALCSNFGVGLIGRRSIRRLRPARRHRCRSRSKMQGNNRVALCFFGDGASNKGTFHESLNLAALWDLPVIYVCENNGYGELTATMNSTSVQHISVRAAGYGMPGVTVDGQDVLAVYDAVDEAVRRARAGEGPSLVETLTYRFENHAIGMPVETASGR